MLTRQKAVLQAEYETVMDRRGKLDEFKLRRYFPKTNGRAEHALFEQAAGPWLNRLKGEMSWRVTVDVRNGKCQVDLQMPDVMGFDQVVAESHLRNLLGGAPTGLVTGFNALKIVRYGANAIKPELERKTIWEIMQLDFDEGWSKRVCSPDADKTLGGYVREHLNELLDWSTPSLSCAPTANLQRSTTLLASTAGMQTAVQAAFMNELLRRDEVLCDSTAFAKTIARVQVDTGIDLERWASHAPDQAQYLDYLGRGPRAQVDIYPHEQNAERLRRVILQLEPNFGGVLGVDVRRCLYDYEVFGDATLAYLLDLIPTRNQDSAGLLHPMMFYAQLAIETWDLSEEWDVVTLFLGVCSPERRNKRGQWTSNADVQASIHKLKDGAVAAAVGTQQQKQRLADGLTVAADQYRFPQVPNAVPDGDTRRLSAVAQVHVKLAFRAVVHDFREGLLRS